MRSVLLGCCLLLLRCRPWAGDPVINGYMREGLAAYRRGDDTNLLHTASMLEDYGLAQGAGSAARHDALIGSARLLSLSGVLHLRFSEVSRLVYLDRLCRPSWADRFYVDPVSPCVSPTPIQSWKAALVVVHPIDMLFGRAEQRLASAGLLMVSPQNAVNLPFYKVMHLEPLRPQAR